MQSNHNKRILAIDLGRGISIPMMMLVHTLLMYSDDNTQYHSWLGHVVHFIGKETPIFLLSMGISFTLSQRSQTVSSSIRKGLIILAAAYSLNFLKFIVPIAVFDAMPESFINAYGWHSPISFGKCLYLFLTGDFLQMAGMSFLFIGFIYKYLPNKYLILALALGIAFSTTFVRGFRLEITWVDYILDLFWGKYYNVYFTIFPWISFILLGMFLGIWYQEKDRDENSMFRIMLPMGLVTLISGASLCYLDFTTHFGDFFHLGFGGTLYLMGVNLWIFWTLHQIAKRTPANAFFNFLCYCSKRVTSLYIIQWVVICWGMMLLGFRAHGVITTLCLMPAVILISFIVQWCLDGIIKIFHKSSVSREKQLVQQSEIVETGG